ncbi:WDGH domain-containing protein [Streptomyces sp. NPDC055794]
MAARHPAVRSRKHHDGEPCSGGGWFTVMAQLPTEQVSNHYRAHSWSLDGDVPEVETAPVWDGHSTTDVARRLHTLLSGDASASVAN